MSAARAAAADRLVANARMYSADPVTTAAWRTLLEWIVDQAGVDWDVIDYPPPQALSKLWSRANLGAVFMCGLPYTLRTPAVQLIAAPIPSPPRYGGRPVYMTDIVVRASSPYRAIEDTFGHTAGFTVTDSQSGYFAFRHFLRPHQQQRAAPLYPRVVGDLLNARGVIDALTADRIDVGPLDSYYHDLLTHHHPEYAAQVRVVASTDPTPIPGFVATSGLDAAVFRRLQQVFIAAGSSADLTAVRQQLLLEGFATPGPESYTMLRARRDALIEAPEVW